MCDTAVVVGPDFVLFGKNSDRDPNEAQVLDWQPRRSFPKNSQLNCTWTTIPQVEQTHAVILSRPYWMWGAEMGTNEHGVVIGNEAVFTRTKRNDEGLLLGMDILRLALERCESAEEAVACIGKLVTTWGQGGRCGYSDPDMSYDNSFLVADHKGAWVVETAGRDWTHEGVVGTRAISNALSVSDFAKGRADRLRGAVARAGARRSQMEADLQAATRPQHMAAALRSHRGNEPSYHPVNGAMGAPCMHAGGLIANGQTVGSWIALLQAEGAEHYATATAAPCLSAFKAISVLHPQQLGHPTGIHDSTSDWWRFEALHRRLIGDPEQAAAFRKERDAWEEATWSKERSADSAFAAWRAFVAAQEAKRVSPKDTRPVWVRRYWQHIESEAAEAVPRLPARDGRS